MAGSDTAITERKELDFVYMEAPDLIINSWRTSKWIPVVEEASYNDCFGSNYEVGSGEVVQIIFESTIDQDLQFFEDDIQLKNGEAEYTLESAELVYDKILNRYLFTQPILLIVDATDFLQFTKEASTLEKGTLNMYRFQDWKKSKEIYNTFITKFYDRYDVIKSTKESTLNKLIERYNYTFLEVRATISYLEATKMQGSFSLFIMGFVSILFAFCILITYCFKVFMSVSEDVVRFKKLDGIGVMRQEKEKLIKVRIRLLMFVPTVLGITIEIGWCYALNFKKIFEIELANTIILRNTLCTGGMFFLIVLVYYNILKSSYFKRIRL